MVGFCNPQPRSGGWTLVDNLHPAGYCLVSRGALVGSVSVRGGRPASGLLAAFDRRHIGSAIGSAAAGFVIAADGNSGFRIGDDSHDRCRNDHLAPGLGCIVDSKAGGKWTKLN